MESERRGRHAIKRPDGQTVYYNKGASDDAIEFLERAVWPHMPPNAKAMGFKLFGEYIRCAGTRRLFSRLAKQYPDLHVIHIVRPNRLDAWVSRQLAKRSGVWEKFVQSSDQRQEPAQASPAEPLFVQPAELKNFFADYQNSDQFIAETFSDGHYLQITYDELASDYHATMQKVFRFLGVSPFRLSPPTEKQNTLPASK